MRIDTFIIEFLILIYRFNIINISFKNIIYCQISLHFIPIPSILSLLKINLLIFV